MTYIAKRIDSTHVNCGGIGVCDDLLPAAAVFTLCLHLQEDMTEDSMDEGPAGAATHPQEPAPMLYDTEVEDAEYIAPSKGKGKGKKKPRVRKGSPDKKSVHAMLSALGVHAQRKSDADFNGHCAHCNGTGEAC